MFNKWKKSIIAHITESNRFGNARFATSKDLKAFERVKGLYIGGEIHGYPKTGHFLTVAGTRSGKLINLIAPNLLGLGGLEGSKVIIDLKGEIAFVTARYQKQIGQNVLILDPWAMVTKDGATFNPMDLINNQRDPEQLADDASIIAEMIVPKSTTGDQFFNNRARSMIAGLLMHIVLTQPQSKRNLGTLWQMLRLSEDDWINLLADMSVSADVVVRAIANEIVSVYNRSEKTFASILSSAQDFTDFLKSPSLQKSLKSSNFDINTLSNGSTTLYVVIPPTHLKSHAQWLRLVVTTSMRAVVRNRNKRVLYILDEFATLGYLPEIETALSTYAGYNISVWAILQDLGQLKRNYGDSWETFISNTAVRQFFGISDKFSADYLSSMFGETTYVTYEAEGNKGKPSATARRLMTPDEVRRGSADNILTIIEQKPVAVFEKKSYLDMPYLDGNHDPNPYHATENKVVEEPPKSAAPRPIAEKKIGYVAPSTNGSWRYKN
jgi:type IV secretion system protein VirD4